MDTFKVSASFLLAEDKINNEEIKGVNVETSSYNFIRIYAHTCFT